MYPEDSTQPPVATGARAGAVAPAEGRPADLRAGRRISTIEYVKPNGEYVKLNGEYVRPIGDHEKRIIRRMTTAGVMLALGVWMGAAASAQPAGGWAGGGATTRPGLAPNPIDQSRALSTRGLPPLPAAPVPEWRLVPERRVQVPGTDREIVIPSYYERLVPVGPPQAPPVTGYGTRGEGPIYIPEPNQAAP